MCLQRHQNWWCAHLSLLIAEWAELSGHTAAMIVSGDVLEVTCTLKLNYVNNLLFSWSISLLGGEQFQRGLLLNFKEEEAPFLEPKIFLIPCMLLITPFILYIHVLLSLIDPTKKLRTLTSCQWDREHRNQTFCEGDSKILSSTWKTWASIHSMIFNNNDKR